MHKIFFAFIAASLALFFYSFTQIDPNLTISQFGLLQVVQQSFQAIGYGNRPLATGLYLALLVILFLLYWRVLVNIQRNRLSVKTFWKTVWISTIILLFSYPAFSYDLFNYMFTAKTVLVYHQNPYEVIPLQFSGIDPWTNFMRWTHLPSAYTPFWILLTLPAYLLGFGHLLTTMWSIKALVAFFHIATIVGIGKILKKIDPKHALLGMAVFAFNPLIIIENLVSGHNDVVMMAAAVWAIVFLLEKKKLLSWVTLSVSVAAKLITLVIVPIWFFAHKKDMRTWMLIAMGFGLLAVVSTREVLPWYWVWILPFIALVPTQRTLVTLSTGISMGLLLRYAPYLYHGHYDPPVRMLRELLTWIPIALAVLAVAVRGKKLTS